MIAIDQSKQVSAAWQRQLSVGFLGSQSNVKMPVQAVLIQPSAPHTQKGYSALEVAIPTISLG